MPEATYADRVRALSERVVAAQKGIRVLDAVKWGEEIQAGFYASGCRELPRVDAAYYRRTPLAVDPADSRAAFREIQRDVAAQLGRANPAGLLMYRMCDERGAGARRARHARVREIRSACRQHTDAFHAGGPRSPTWPPARPALRDRQRVSLPLAHEIPTPQVGMLQERLDRFCRPSARVRVTESDGIVADAAAGSDASLRRTRSGASATCACSRRTRVGCTWARR
jgi:hypothetical protein